MTSWPMRWRAAPPARWWSATCRRAGAPLLRVADTLAGLTALGAAGAARSAARVAAVTGSVGKTSTKEMLRAALAPSGRVHAADASYNNHWGVPLTLARMARDAQFAVIEIGMNHPGENRAAGAPRAAACGADHHGGGGAYRPYGQPRGDRAGEGLDRRRAGTGRHGAAAGPHTPMLPLLREAAGAARVATFGEGGGAQALRIAADAEGSDIEAGSSACGWPTGSARRGCTWRAIPSPRWRRWRCWAATCRAAPRGSRGSARWPGAATARHPHAGWRQRAAAGRGL